MYEIHLVPKGPSVIMVFLKVFRQALSITYLFVVSDF